MPDGPTIPAYLDRATVADALGLCERTLRRIEQQHAIPVLRIGRQVRYDRRAIAALEDACRSPSLTAPVEPASGSPAPSPPPGRRKGSASDAVLAAMSQDLQRKKRPRSRRRSCATTTTANVVALGDGPRPRCARGRREPDILGARRSSHPRGGRGVMAPCKHLGQSSEAYRIDANGEASTRVLLCGWVTEEAVAALPCWLQDRAWSGGPISDDMRECVGCPLYMERTPHD